MKKGHLIKSVDPGSIAEEMELEPGDVLLTIDGDEIEDIFDYEYKITVRRLRCWSARRTARSGNWIS